MDKCLTRGPAWCHISSVSIPEKSMKGCQIAAVALFLLLHAGVAAGFFFPPTPRLLLWLAATYSVRMFGVTAGYHRYFSHRSYRMGRVAQFLMAISGPDLGAEGRSVVGRASSRPSSPFGP